MPRLKKATCTFLVAEALRRADDFRTAKQLQAETGCNTNQVSAALISMKAYKAVDVMACGGVLFWYATPDTDARSRVQEERTPETEPRKKRKYTRRKKI